jgi:hypothetical protein
VRNLDTKIPRTVNGPLIKGLRELVEYIIDDGNDRVMILKARSKLFRDAEKQGREPSVEEEQEVTRITPSPVVNIIDSDDSGGLEWRFHILHREKDLQEQLRYMRSLLNDIRARITDLEYKDIMYSYEAQERTMKYYIESAEEMGVSIHEGLLQDWLSKEELTAREISIK